MPANVPRNGGLIAQRRTVPSLPNVTIAYAGPNTWPFWHLATVLAVASSACFAATESKPDAGDVSGSGGGVSATGGTEDAKGGAKAVAVTQATGVAVVAVGRLRVAT